MVKVPGASTKPCCCPTCRLDGLGAWLLDRDGWTAAALQRGAAAAVPAAVPAPQVPRPTDAEAAAVTRALGRDGVLAALHAAGMSAEIAEGLVAGGLPAGGG